MDDHAARGPGVIEEDGGDGSDSAGPLCARSSWLSGLLDRLLDLGDVYEPPHHGGWRA